MRETTWTLVSVDGECPLCGEIHKPAQLETTLGPRGKPLTSWSHGGYWIALDGRGRMWFHGPWGDASATVEYWASRTFPPRGAADDEEGKGILPYDDPQSPFWRGGGGS